MENNEEISNKFRQKFLDLATESLKETGLTMLNVEFTICQTGEFIRADINSYRFDQVTRELEKWNNNHLHTVEYRR